MAIGTWLRAIDTVASLARVARQVKKVPAENAPGLGMGQLETRLAGVVVTALKEAFERDSARLDLERTRLEAERRRIEEEMRQQMARHVAQQATAQTRLVMAISALVWIGSLAAMVFDPNEIPAGPKVALAAGWCLLLGAVACGLAANSRTQAWLLNDPSLMGPPSNVPAKTAPWLVLVGAALTGAGLILTR